MINPKQKAKRAENPFPKKVRKEFNIDYRSYYYLCFEGEYVSEIVDFVRKETTKEFFKFLDTLKSRYGNVVILKKDYIKLKTKW